MVDLFEAFEKATNNQKYKIGREICANMMRYHAKYGRNLTAEMIADDFDLSESAVNDILAGAGSCSLTKYKEVLQYTKDMLK